METIIKDYCWTIGEETCIIRNVPFILLDTFEGEEHFASNVSIKLAALRDLMYENLISKDVDFNTFNGIEF